MSLMEEQFIPCVPAPDLGLDNVLSANNAIQLNPFNRPSPGRVQQLIERLFSLNLTDAPDPNIIQPQHLAVMTSKYWGVGGIRLTVGFPFDSTPSDLQNKILSHMNEWGKYCNVKFTLTNTDPQVRISRAGSGYWSYLGTDIKLIPRNQPTMNLQGFTMNTPDKEFYRVVGHETGHTMGFPHEHMREELVNRLDRAKTIAYFQQTQGWSAQMTTQQVLTPLSSQSIMGTPNADQDSLMCYQLPGSITKDGLPIRGGSVINTNDQQFSAKLYPLPNTPPPVEPSKELVITVNQNLEAGIYTLKKA